MELDQTQFAHRLVSGMSDAIVYADAEGVIRLWNRGATRIFGFTEAEALGRSLNIIIPESLRERHWQGYCTRMRTERGPAFAERDARRARERQRCGIPPWRCLAGNDFAARQTTSGGLN